MVSLVCCQFVVNLVYVVLLPQLSQIQLRWYLVSGTGYLSRNQFWKGE